MFEPAYFEYRLNGKVHTVQLVKPAMCVGRDSGCEVRISDQTVSREHARVCHGDDGWTISDSNSRNGIYVNDKKVSSQRLTEGDRIRIGSIDILFSFSRPREAPRASEESFVSQIHVPHFKDLLSSGRLLESSHIITPSGQIEEGAQESSTDWALPLLSRAAQALISSVELQDMLDTVIELVFENLPAERVCVILYENEKEEALRVGRSAFDDTAGQFTISSTILKKTLEQRSAVLVADSLADEDLAAQRSVIMNQIRSAMCAPLYNDDKVAGIIYADTQSVRNPFFHSHLEVLTTLALLSAAAVQKAQLLNEMRAEQDIRRRLERYSAPGVVDRIIRTEQEALTKEEVEASILFLDLVKFTALAESLPSVDVLEILNTVLKELTECVFQYEGTLDKFTGDGLMAIFGAPLPQTDHALRAVRTAVAMEKTLEELNRGAPGGHNIEMRVGINSGRVIAGDIGSPRRRDYTVIGDVVNTASRLESEVAKPNQIVIGQATYEQVKDAFLCQELGSMTVKGRRQALTAYVVVGERN